MEQLLRKKGINVEEEMHVNNVKKPVPYYSLDVIISVGYRVKSMRGVEFRRWANSVLKNYIIKGYAVNNNRILSALHHWYRPLKALYGSGFVFDRCFPSDSRR